MTRHAVVKRSCWGKLGQMKSSPVPQRGGGGHGYRRTGLRTESERGSRTAHSLYTKLRLLPRNLEFAMHPLSTRARHAIVDAGAIAQIHCDSSGILYTPYLHTHTRVLQ